MRIVSITLAALLVLLVHAVAANDVEKADAVLVVKSEKRLYLMKKEKVIGSYGATFGAQPKGHKERQGDERTPEGRYTLGHKNRNSAYYKSIRISYPNAEDRKKARQRGDNPGGDIMIHGQTNGWGWAAPVVQWFPWTDGCIALSDEDMDRVWEAVEPGVPIEIRP